MLKNSKFKIDKSVFLYIGASCLITLIIGSICILIGGTTIYTASIGGALGAFACGITKEWTDGNNVKNYWNWADILANLIGCLIGVGILILFFHILQNVC